MPNNTQYNKYTLAYILNTKNIYNLTKLLNE